MATIESWVPALEAAYRRVLNPVSTLRELGQAERGRQRMTDIGIAAYFLREDVPANQVSKALCILISLDALSDEDRKQIARAIAIGRIDSLQPLQQVALVEGDRMLRPICFASMAADVGPEKAAKVLRPLVAKNPSILDTLAGYVADFKEATLTRRSAIQLLDQLTTGPEAFPAPQKLTKELMAIVQNGNLNLSAWAIDALIRQPTSGWKDEDRNGLLFFSSIQGGGADSIRIEGRNISAVATPRVAPLLATALANNLKHQQAAIRGACAYVLSTWPLGARYVSEELGGYIATAPIENNLVGEPPSDLGYLQACTTVLVRNGKHSKPAAMAILPALLDPDRRELAERVLDAIGPEAADMVSVDYAMARMRDSPTMERMCLVMALSQLTRVSATAEQTLVLVLWSNEPSAEIRAIACQGLRRASSQIEQARRVLLAECASPSMNIRSAAAASLTKLGMGDKLPLDIPLSWVRSNDAKLRVTGAKLLRSSGPRAAETAIAPLLRMADNVDPVQRYAAARALVAIDPKGENISPAVLSSVLNKDIAMRKALLPIMKEVGSEKLREKLKDIAENEPDLAVRLAAQETMQGMKK